MNSTLRPVVPLAMFYLKTNMRNLTVERYHINQINLMILQRKVPMWASVSGCHQDGDDWTCSRCGIRLFRGADHQRCYALMIIIIVITSIIIRILIRTEVGEALKPSYMNHILCSN